MAVVALATFAGCQRSGESRTTPALASPSATDSNPEDETVLAAFERLDAKLISAVEQRDVQAAHLSTAPGPARRRAVRAIQELRADNVIDLSRFDSVRIRLKRESASDAVVIQTRHVFPCFKTEGGRVVTSRNIAVEQRVEWHLVMEEEWRLLSGRLMSDRRIPDAEAACV